MARKKKTSRLSSFRNSKLKMLLFVVAAVVLGVIVVNSFAAKKPTSKKVANSTLKITATTKDVRGKSKPLAGAKVKIKPACSKVKSGTTNRRGQLTVKKCRAGRIAATVTVPGYYSVKVASRLQARKTLTLKLTLNKIASPPSVVTPGTSSPPTPTPPAQPAITFGFFHDGDNSTIKSALQMVAKTEQDYQQLKNLTGDPEGMDDARGELRTNGFGEFGKDYYLAASFLGEVPSYEEDDFVSVDAVTKESDRIVLHIRNAFYKPGAMCTKRQSPYAIEMVSKTDLPIFFNQINQPDPCPTTPPEL